MKYDDFLEELKILVQGVDEYNIPEEEYFRKLLFQVELNAAKNVTANLLLAIFKESFTSESVQFDENWNSIEEPALFTDAAQMSNKEELEFTKNTLRFFISDLRRLGDKVLKDPHRGFGLTSSSGAKWYNFDITSIVYGWDSFCNDSSGTSAENSNECIYSWCDISDILVFGKGYE
ncbi:hypothetical protein [Kordia sp.]|uniref:hypothetical protein n=1 Tax=Kordia sp. TaxID=1965332 RepID=UPI003D6C52AA